MNIHLKLLLLLVVAVVMGGCVTNRLYRDADAHQLKLDRPILQPLSISVVCAENDYLPPADLRKLIQRIASESSSVTLVPEGSHPAAQVTIRVGGLGKRPFREVYPEFGGVSGNASVVTLDAVWSVAIDNAAIQTSIIRGTSSQGALLIRPVDEQMETIRQLGSDAAADMMCRGLLWVSRVMPSQR